MKRIIISIYILLFFSSLSNTPSLRDEIDIKWSTTEKGLKKTPLGDVVGYDESGIYVTYLQPILNMGIITYAAGGPNLSYLIQHYDNDMKSTRFVKVELDKDYEYKTILHFGNELYVFSTFQDKKNKKKELYAQKIDKKTLRVGKEKLKIASAFNTVSFGENRYNAFNYIGDRFYKIKLSRDKSKLLIYYSQTTEKKTEHEHISVQVYDSGLRESWRNTYKLPCKDDLFIIESLRVSDEGKVYLLGKEYKEKLRERVDGMPNYTYKLFSFSNKIDSFDNYQLNLEDKFLTNIEMAVAKQANEVVCSGYYSENGKSGKNGSFYFRIDTEKKEIIKSKSHAFSSEIMTAILGNKEKKKLDKTLEAEKDINLNNYKFDEIILREDGGVVLISEYRRRKVFSGSDDAIVKYYRNNIIIINISPSGEVEWSTKIAKKQVDTNSEYFLSYSTAVVNDKIYFIFNDKAENATIINSDNIKFFTPNKKTVTTIVQIDSNGRQKKDIIFSYDDIKLFTIPSIFEQISDNEMVLFAGKEMGKSKAAKLTFN